MGIASIAGKIAGVRRTRRPATADAPAFDLSYIRTGEPSDCPVLVIPGGPGLASVLPYLGFRRRAAARGLDLIMVEHRGIGYSRFDLEGDDLPLSAMRTGPVVDDLAAVLDAEAVESALVYGASYGTYLAAGFGLRHPGRVGAMVLDSAILSTEDYLVEREVVRDTLWRGATAGMVDTAAMIRKLAREGVDADNLLLITRAVYEMGGPELLGRLVRVRLADPANRIWRQLNGFISQNVKMNKVPYIQEIDLVGAIAFRELRYAPEPDGELFDPAVGLGGMAGAYPPFSGEPFDLAAAFPSFTWPTVLLSGRYDLRTPPAIAQRIAGLIPDAILVEINNGHSALESHELAAIRVLERLLEGRQHEICGAELDNLARRGMIAGLGELLQELIRGA